MRERCHRCDRPAATDEDYASCADDPRLCWDGERCAPRDWRGEALLLREAYAACRLALESLMQDAADPSRQGEGEDGDLLASLPTVWAVDRAHEAHERLRAADPARAKGGE